MKRLQSLVLILSIVLGTSSCAAIKRAFSTDGAKSDASPRELAAEYHPEGEIGEMWVKCSVNGPSERRMLVYLPKGYSESDKYYPALYLIHGARGNETSWIKDGKLTMILDSLVTTGAVGEFIVILPNMNQYDDDADFGNSRFKKPFESLFDVNGAVETGFAEDVVKAAESKYRIIPDKAHRAIAGLSVGGMQAIFISAHHPDLFDYVGLFSPFYKSPIRKSDYSDFYKNLKQLQKVQFADPPALYAIMIGNNDFFVNHVEYFRRYLRDNSFPFEYLEIKGGHDWDSWKKFLTEFSKRIFNENQ